MNYRWLIVKSLATGDVIIDPFINLRILLFLLYSACRYFNREVLTPHIYRRATRSNSKLNHLWTNCSIKRNANFVFHSCASHLETRANSTYFSSNWVCWFKRWLVACAMSRELVSTACCAHITLSTLTFRCLMVALILECDNKKSFQHRSYECKISISNNKPCCKKHIICVWKIPRVLNCFLYCLIFLLPIYLSESRNGLGWDWHGNEPKSAAILRCFVSCFIHITSQVTLFILRPFNSTSSELVQQQFNLFCLRWLSRALLMLPSARKSEEIIGKQFGS